MPAAQEVPTAVLEGRVAIVAGGGSRIGRSLALGLADHGASVGVVGDWADPVKDEITGAGSRSVALGCGFKDRAETTEAFAQVAATLGPIDLVVHISPTPPAAPLVETDEASWDAHGENLLRAGLWTAQAARAELAGRGGTIVFVTPTVAMTGAAGLVPYATAMEGQRALARAAARQWGIEGIRVNCVAPPLEAMSAALPPAEGTAPLNATALGRPPDGRSDIAPVIAMLAADTGHFVTGNTIVVDGGVWMAP